MLESLLAAKRGNGREEALPRQAFLLRRAYGGQDGGQAQKTQGRGPRVGACSVTGWHYFLVSSITMTAITLTSKGQATIPKQIRDLLGVKPSGRITFEVRDGEVILRALGNPAGMLSAYARARPGRGVAASIGRHLARRDVRSHAD